MSMTDSLFDEPSPPTPEPVFEEFTRKNGDVLRIRLVGQSPLWGHLLWSASRVLANYLDRDLTGKRVLELGAAGALPSIICAINGAKVMVTDYPDPDLLENMHYNVDKYGVDVEGYIWGRDTEDLCTNGKYDILILSDLIFNHQAHGDLLKTCRNCLKKDGHALVFFTHHRPHLAAKDNAFFDLARQIFTVEKIVEDKSESNVMFENDAGSRDIMPLLTITGFPSAGKTVWAERLRSEMEGRMSGKLSVIIVNDESLGIDRADFSDARREKAARGLLFSAVERHLSKTCIVICDALNYIKGFRYQLSCSAKALGTPHCLVHIGCPVEQCRKWNARTGAYTDNVLDELVMRYEEPNAQTKWDSPCFNIFWEDERAPVDEIWDALVNRKIARPNAATLMAPAVDTDYLYQLDKLTQHIISMVQETQRMGGEKIEVDGLTLTLPDQVIGVGALQRLRRQFLSINRNMMITEKIQQLFVEFLGEHFST